MLNFKQYLRESINQRLYEDSPYAPPPKNMITQNAQKPSGQSHGGPGPPGPYGTPGPDLRDLPPHWDGSSASAVAWMNWFLNAIQSGTLAMMYSMPPQIAIDGFGWPPAIVAQIQAAWDGLTEILYSDAGQRAGAGWDVNGLMWILNQWQTGTPPINP